MKIEKVKKQHRVAEHCLTRNSDPFPPIPLIPLQAFTSKRLPMRTIESRVHGQPRVQGVDVM